MEQKNVTTRVGPSSRPDWITSEPGLEQEISTESEKALFFEYSGTLSASRCHLQPSTRCFQGAILMSNAFIPGVASYGSMPIATVLVRM
jgi:hypothetical protein